MSSLCRKTTLFLGLFVTVGFLAAFQSFAQTGAVAPEGYVYLSEVLDRPVACTVPLGLSYGTTADAVYLLQKVLNQGGYYPEGLITGYYGDLTKAAVERFQIARGYAVDGSVISGDTFLGVNALVVSQYPVCGSTNDPAILGALLPAPIVPSSGFVTLSGVSSPISCTLPSLTQGTTAPAVSLLQTALYKGGYYPLGIVTGYYGVLTKTAVEMFQSAFGLSISGSAVSGATLSTANSKLIPATFPEECGLGEAVSVVATTTTASGASANIPSPSMTVSPNGDWRASFVVSGQYNGAERALVPLTLGMSAAATDQFDIGTDVLAPPPHPDASYPQAYITNTSHPSFYQKLAFDIRSHPADPTAGKTWIMTVSNNTFSDWVMRWDFSSLPATWSTATLTQVGGSTFNLRSVSSVAIRARSVATFSVFLKGEAVSSVSTSTAVIATTTTTTTTVITSPTTVTSSSLCTDTDGGKNHTVKGTVTGRAGTFSDTCYASRLLELWCRPGSYESEGYYTDCPYGCGNGACLPAPASPATTTTTVVPAVVTTTTSVTVATTTTTSSGTSGTTSDTTATSTTSSSTGTSSTNSTTTTATTPSTSLGTATASSNNTTFAGSLCTDSDGGKSYGVKGTTYGKAITGSFTTIADRCVAGVLVEYWCLPGFSDLQSDAVECLYGCQDGVCRASTASNQLSSELTAQSLSAFERIQNQVQSIIDWLRGSAR